jgi:non-specific serine/threonine protein kinase
VADVRPSLQDAFADRYPIVREIGRGVSACVYLADDLKHGRSVAIKVLNDETLAAIGPDRFLREIEIAARLTHPHILPLHDSGSTHGYFYYVMPYIEGEPLRGRMKREGLLPIDDALRIAREIASALAHAHRLGMVHRDIKPENILLADGYALVADFGMARRVNVNSPDEWTSDGRLIGTPAYMAPEQAACSPEVDSRADLYALGCMLYEMLAGQRPFAGPLEALLRQHMTVEPRPVSDLRPLVPKTVAAAIMKALAKLPADRHPTAARMAEALVLTAEAPVTPARPDPGSVSAPNNLPTQRSSFVGRERELTESTRLLGETRLLTLTGIGGCGKTRLALKIAEQQLASFPDGVWFVDLAPVQEAERVVLAIATVIGVNEAPGFPLRQRVVERLASCQSLILLDNCEHVIEVAAETVEAMLAACPRIKILVTSREGLGVSGEQILAVRSLALPAVGNQDLSTIEASDSVKLFLDRGRLADPRFSFEPATAPVIAEICRRLDGIPLAIELAAARVKMLSVEEIRSRLGDRFRLLTGLGKSALGRHQTLQATISWSYDQLSDTERSLFRRLSVFSGGWTLEAAVRVAGEDEDEFGMLDWLTRLADKSLVGPERVAGGATRYSMLETVRQYAQDRLSESGEGDDARERHLAYFLSLAEEARPRLQGPQQGEWLARFDAERENLLSAHAWCDREAGGEAGLRLVYAMQLYWVPRGLLELGYQITTESLARPAAQGRTLARVLALYAAGQLGYLIGRFDEAEAWLAEGLSIAREIDDPLRIASVLRALGFVALGRNDLVSARKRLEESLRLTRELGEKRELSIVVNALAELERIEGNLDAAEPLYREFLALTRELGNTGYTASGLLNLAMVSVGRGALEPARTMLQEALSIGESIGSQRVGQGVLEVAAGIAASTGDGSLAARLFGAADALRGRMGLHRDPADERFLLPLIDRARASMGEGAFRTAEATGRTLTYEEATGELRRVLEAASGQLLS